MLARAEALHLFIKVPEPERRLNFESETYLNLSQNKLSRGKKEKEV